MAALHTDGAPGNAARHARASRSLSHLSSEPPSIPARPRSGNFLSKSAADAPHTQHGALCLETENFPDAVNRAAHGFPPATLQPGQAYKATTVHKFTW